MAFGRGIIVGHLVTLRRFLRTFLVGHGRTLKRRGGGHQPFDFWFGKKSRGHEPTVQQDSKTEGLFTVEYPDERLPVYERFRVLPMLVYDDADGNVQHLQEHEVTIEEAEEVLLDPESSRASSRTSGLPTAFGWTSTGRHLAVVYEVVDADPLTFRPVTAYDVPPPTKRKGRKR